jgi:exonuclease SbcD
MRRHLLAHIADSHYDHASRWEDTCALHEWIEGDLSERRPDAIVHAGDIYERPSVPSERIRVAEWLCDLAKIAPVLVVRGNHDELYDIDIFRALGSIHRIEVEEAYGLHTLGPFTVAALAWPRQAEVLARERRDSKGLPTTREQSAALAQEALRNVIGGMGALLDKRLVADAGPSILAAHAMVRGAKTGLGQPLVGCDMELGIEDLALARADYVALGHIHMGQEWFFNGSPIVYPGSPRRTEFGELEEKGYVIAEFRDEPFEGARPTARGWHVKFERIRTPARPMLLFEATFDDALGKHLFDWPKDVRGAEIRLRYTTDRDKRVAAKAGALELRDLLLSDGAFSVTKPEEVVRSTARARVPEIVRKTLPQKFDIYCATRDLALSDERRARLHQRLALLESKRAAL